MPVEIWGDYEVDLDHVLGRGGMGTVYKGRQISLSRWVAIKSLRGDVSQNAEFIQRFRREAELLAQLVDAHVVQVYAAGEHDGTRFYAMEYVEGEDIAALLRAGHAFSTGEIIRIAKSVGLALKAANRFRIVHRDIKPSNILITKAGDIKVMDFGLAKNPETDFTCTGLVMGTAKYMAPEQATGGLVDVRSDLYSLGAVLYEMGAGAPPFDAENATSILFQHVHRDPVPPRRRNPSLPERLERVILRCLEKEPGRRYASPDEFLAALSGAPRPATRAGKPSQQAETSPRSSRIRWAALVPLILAGAAFAGWGLLREETAKASPAESSSLAGTREPSSREYKAALEAGEFEKARRLASTAMGAGEEASRAAEREISFREHLSAGKSFFGNRLWDDAGRSLQEALRCLGAADPRRTEVRRELDKVDYWKKMGDRDYEAALGLADRAYGRDSDEWNEVNRLYRVERFETLEERARELEYRDDPDWAGARAAYEEAIPYCPEARRGDVEKARDFCADMAEAWEAEAGSERNPRRAQELYEKHRGTPRGHANHLHDALSRVGTELERKQREETARLETMLRDRSREAMTLRNAGRWREALAAAEDAARIADSMSRKEIGVEESLQELRRAAAAPSGFAYVPAGPFVMGSGSGRPWEAPAREVTTAGFYMMVREVSRQEYGRFLMSEESSSHVRCPSGEPESKDHRPERWTGANEGDAPVTGIDGYDASAYAAWAGCRLPTEAEWEKAAAWDGVTGQPRKYPWGVSFDPHAEDVSFLGVQGMGSGLFDWTASSFNPYPGGGRRHSDFGRELRVLRGGILLEEDAAENARCSFRYWHSPDRRDASFSFRCVKDVD